MQIRHQGRNIFSPVVSLIIYKYHGKPGIIYRRVLVKKCPGLPIQLVEIHCTRYQLLSRSCSLFHYILLVCMERGHWVSRTLNFFTPVVYFKTNYVIPISVVHVIILTFIACKIIDPSTCISPRTVLKVLVFPYKIFCQLIALAIQSISEGVYCRI